MKILQLLALLFLFISCGPAHNDEEVKLLYDEVIRIHDEVMPKISDINKLKKRVRKLEKNDETSIALIKQLQDADDAMMDWMADFQKYKTLADSSKTVKMDYLNVEKQKIQSVSDQMLLSIDTAKKYLND